MLNPCVAYSALKGTREGDQHIASVVSLDPGVDLGEPLVLLADVVSLAQVDQVDDGLGSEQHEGVDDLNLLVVPVTATDVLVVLDNVLQQLLENSLFDSKGKETRRGLVIDQGSCGRSCAAWGAAIEQKNAPLKKIQKVHTISA